jgi:translocation and assembly module TamA
MLCATSLAVAAQPAAAFEFLGFRFFERDDDEAGIVDPRRYTVTLEVSGADPRLTKKLNDGSQLVTEKDRPVSGSLGLLTRARNDRERLVAALYEEARYEGVVTILVEGKSIDDLPADAEFGSNPVPVSITVDPGAPFVLGQVNLQGDAAGLSPEEFDLAAGGDAGSVRILKAEKDIVRKLKEQGRPLATVTGRDVIADHNTKTLDVAISVAAGPVAGYGATAVEGTQQVDRDFTAYMAGLEPGRIYSPDDLDSARDRLTGLGVFNSVAVTEAAALDENGNIPVKVTVTERKPRVLGVGATLSNTEGLGLEGYWGHRNLFGRAEKLRIEGSISRIGADTDIGKLNYNAAIMFERPGVVGPASRFFANTRTVYEHPDAYDRFSSKASVGLAYDISKSQSVSGELSVDYSKITDAFVDNRDYLIVSTPLQYVFDNRDEKLNPTEGFRMLAYAEPAYDTIGGTTFVKLRGEASGYQALDTNDRYVVAGRVNLGSILGAGVAEIPADRRFYAGGGGSVRGYAYQGIGPKDSDNKPTGGLSLFETSAELRMAVTDKFGIVPFVDAGTVSLEEFPDFSDLKFGAGVGLRYLTPFGPLRIDAAVPLNKGHGDPDFGIYAGVGQAF